MQFNKQKKNKKPNLWKNPMGKNVLQAAISSWLNIVVETTLFYCQSELYIRQIIFIHIFILYIREKSHRRGRNKGKSKIVYTTKNDLWR